MDNTHKYFFDSMNPEDFYDLRKNGRLYKFNFPSSSWEEVTYHVTLDASWIPLSRNECYNKLLAVYIDCSIYNLSNHPEYYPDVEIPTHISKNLTYYSTYRCVYAIDKRENVYICLPSGLMPCPELNGQDPGDLNTIPTYLVMEHIPRIEQFPLILFELDLYVDKDNNVVGIDKETKEGYKLSRLTKSLDKMYDFKNEKKTWKSIAYRDIEQIYDPSFIDEYDCEILKDKKDAQDIVHKYIISSEDREQFGKEFLYFRDFFGVVYAIDENNNEYRLDQDGMKKITKGILLAPLIEHLDVKEVMISIVNHTNHKAELGKKKNLDANEVLCFEDEDDEIWGKTEDGKCYYFNQDTGEFESILKKDWPKDLTLMTDVQDNCEFQAECRMGYKIQQYAVKYSKGKVDNLYEFFVEDEDNVVKAVYGTDIDDNEYSLTSTSITPVEQGTIKIDEFTHINECSLFVALDDLEKNGE